MVQPTSSAQIVSGSSVSALTIGDVLTTEANGCKTDVAILAPALGVLARGGCVGAARRPGLYKLDAKPGDSDARNAGSLYQFGSLRNWGLTNDKSNLHHRRANRRQG